MESLRLAILEATRHILMPLIKFLIRFGIGHREFSELSKKTFVDVAAQDFGVRGRPTNTSRIAVLTGLPRKQVKRLREQRGIGEFGTTHMTQASLLLAAWFSDPNFIGKNGSPRQLAFDSGTPSFVDLVNKYGRDIPAVAMLKELKRTGAVKVLPSGKLSVKSKTNLAKGSDSESVRRAGAVIHHMLSTVIHNLACESADDLRLERRSFSIQLKPKYFEEFRKFASIEGQKFVETIESWISAHEYIPAEGGEPTRLIGAGVYMFEDENAIVA